MCRKLENVILQFKAWCCANRLIINLEKTMLVQFRDSARSLNINGLRVADIDMNFGQSVGFLGAIVDGNLSWDKHADYITGKLNSAYFAINSLKSKFDRVTLRTVYYAIFYPHLCYGIAAWGRLLITIESLYCRNELSDSFII